MNERAELACKSDSQLTLKFWYLIPKNVVEHNKEPYDCTGRLLRNIKPELHKAAVRMLGEGLGGNWICKTLNISDHTLAGIREECAADIATHKKGMAGRVISALYTTIDRIEDQAPTGNLRDSWIGFGIGVDKFLQLSDQVTSRIEIGVSVNIHEEFAKFHAETMKLVEAIEVGSQIGLDEKCAEQKALGPASDGNATIEAGTDVMSVVSSDPSMASDSVNANVDADPSDLDAQKAEGPSQDSEGGRGSAAQLGPANFLTGSEPQNFINKGSLLP